MLKERNICQRQSFSFPEDETINCESILYSFTYKHRNTNVNLRILSYGGFSSTKETVNKCETVLFSITTAILSLELLMGFSTLQSNLK